MRCTEYKSRHLCATSQGLHCMDYCDPSSLVRPTNSNSRLPDPMEKLHQANHIDASSMASVPTSTPTRVRHCGPKDQKIAAAAMRVLAEYQ